MFLSYRWMMVWPEVLCTMIGYANLCRNQTMWSNHIQNFVRDDMLSQGNVILRQHMMLVFHLLLVWDVYYGNIKEILEIQFPGMAGLRCVVFYCDWYDTTPNRGVKIDAFGVTSVHSRRKIQYYDPFILGSQADQVCQSIHNFLPI